MRRWLLCATMILPLLSGQAGAGAELLLEDGQLLRGRSVERKDDLYLLQLETDAVLPIPVALVHQVRLTGDDDPPATGLKQTEPQTLAGPPGGPKLPDRTKQTEVLGEPASFRKGAIDPSWRPTSDWDLSPDLNQFNPARWYAPPIDPTWQPLSVFRASSDVTQFNPARWYAPPIDPTWWPKDGFESRPPLFRPAQDRR